MKTLWNALVSALVVVALSSPAAVAKPAKRHTTHHKRSPSSHGKAHGKHAPKHAKKKAKGAKKARKGPKRVAKKKRARRR